jgi:hypothetical protein
MKTTEQIINFDQGLDKLGFLNDDSLFLINVVSHNPEINFHLEKAKKFKADAVFLRKQFTGNYKPQVYLFDFTEQGFNKENEDEIALIQKQIWSSGEAPLACFFFDTEIKIVNCTTSTKLVNSVYKPNYLEQLEVAEIAHKLYNEQFAVKIKSGVFWDELENEKKFKFSNSAYDILISWIKKVTGVLINENANIQKRVINKIIIQSILIKYLEEKIDEKNRNLFGDKYFPQFDNATSFTDVLRKGMFVGLLEKLHTDFNGNLFAWEEDEKIIISKCNLCILADALEGTAYSSGQLVICFDDIKLYEFNYIPVELISRLYEEFLAGDNQESETKKNKQNEGIFYTPSHLARLLVDEAMPLKSYTEIDLNTYKVLDPACGSGIFLVIAFKRLVQWWRLQNGIEKPREVADLKKLLKCVYGTDKEDQATRLAAFSLCLALCDELSPMQIITKLKFDDLTQSNILHTDFFINELKSKEEDNVLLIGKQITNYKKLSNVKFDLVIGNPPFNRGAIKDYSNIWKYDDEEVNIPQGQIALKFLSESLPFLKENGIQCLIIKSSGLLYNSTSEKYKNLLFSKLNVIQIFDFTALARNRSLWDNGADVASAAIFLRKSKPDFKKNILHVTFRRTKATKERLIFEIDDYDLHFVNRDTAINCDYIWKTNLLGGGRIKSVLKKYDEYQTFESYLKKNDCITNEGFIIGSKGKLKPKWVFDIQTLPTQAITEDYIDYSRLTNLNKNISFEKISEEIAFKCPNLILWENIGTKRLPVFFNEKTFSFKAQVMSIVSINDNRNLLKNILESINTYSDFYRFNMFSKSSYLLINRNTAVLKIDFMHLPFLPIEHKSVFSKFESSVMRDVNGVMRDFLVKGESSYAIKPIPSKELNPIFENYGKEFSSVLNQMYEDGNKKFRLDEVVSIDNSFIATVFKYDDNYNETVKYSTQLGLDLAGLTHHQVSQHLSSNRIIKLYPQKDTIIFVKPNQYRYWISLIAYRDADKCFADLSKAGY